MNGIIKLRGLVSTLLIIVFILVFVSGIGLHFAPSGRIAKEIGWNFLGFDKWGLERIHTITGFLMSGLVVIHLLLNYKMFISEIKLLFRRKK